MSSVLSSIISSFFGSSEMKMKMKDVFYTIIQFLNINNHENENDSTITTASLVFNLILVYLVVFIVVFVVVMTYQFYSNFIHLTSCLDHINECHIERRSQQQEENNKLGKYATILIGSGSQHGGGGNTRNSAIVGLLYTRILLNHYEHVIILDSDSQVTDLVRTMSSSSSSDGNKNSTTTTASADSDATNTNTNRNPSPPPDDDTPDTAAATTPTVKNKKKKRATISAAVEESERSIVDPFNFSERDNDGDDDDYDVDDDDAKENTTSDQPTITKQQQQQQQKQKRVKRKYFVQEWFRQQFSSEILATQGETKDNNNDNEEEEGKRSSKTTKPYHTPVHVSILPLSWRIVRKLFPTVIHTCKSKLLGNIQSSFDYGLCCNWFIYGKKLLQRPTGDTTVGNISRGFFEYILYQDLQYNYGINVVCSSSSSTTNTSSTTTSRRNSASSSRRITWINQVKFVGLEQELPSSSTTTTTTNSQVIEVSGVRIIVTTDTVSKIRNIPMFIHSSSSHDDYDGRHHDSSIYNETVLSLKTNFIVDCIGYCMTNVNNSSSSSTGVHNPGSASSSSTSSSLLFSIPVPPIEVYNPKIQYSARAYAFEDDEIGNEDDADETNSENRQHEELKQEQQPRRSKYYSKQTARQKIDKIMAGVGGTSNSSSTSTSGNNDDEDDVQPDEIAIYQTYPFGNASGKHAYLFRSEQNVIIQTCFGIGGYNTPKNVSKNNSKYLGGQQGDDEDDTHLNNSKYIEQYLESSLASLTPVLEEELIGSGNSGGSGSNNEDGDDFTRQRQLQEEQLQSILNDSLSSLIAEHGKELDDWTKEILNDKRWKRWLQQLERKEHLRQHELCIANADCKLFDTIQFEIPPCYVVQWERLVSSASKSKWRSSQTWADGSHYVVNTIPCNFIAAGDAYCSMNPIYNQGFTMDCVAAITLDHILRKTKPPISSSRGFLSYSNPSSSPASISSRYFTLLQSRFQEVWFVQKSMDYQRKSCVCVVGEKRNSWMFKFVRFYYRRLFMLAQHDARVHQMLFKVLGMEEQSWVLFTPDIILKVHDCKENKAPPKQKEQNKTGKEPSPLPTGNPSSRNETTKSLSHDQDAIGKASGGKMKTL